MHVYGYIQEKDKAAARECIGGWDQFTPSACSSAQRSFVKTNLEALKAGNITAKSQRDYQIANPNIFSAQAKPGHKPDRHNKPPFDGPYGFVPKTGTEPLTHTIEGRYMGQGDDDAGAWLDDQEKAQKKLKNHEEPAFRVAELNAKLKPTVVLAARLNAKKKPVVIEANATNAALRGQMEAASEAANAPAAANLAATILSSFAVSLAPWKRSASKAAWSSKSGCGSRGGAAAARELGAAHDV